MNDIINELDLYKKTEMLVTPLLDKIMECLMSGTWRLLRRDTHLIHLSIGDCYFKIWNSNEPEHTQFYDHDLLKFIPEDKRAPLRILLNACVDAKEKGMSLQEYSDSIEK